MDYTINYIDKIVGYKTWSDKKKTDTLLFIDCRLHTELGIESTKKEKQQVQVNSRKIYTAIKKVNPRMGSDFLRLMDKE